MSWISARALAANVELAMLLPVLTPLVAIGSTIIYNSEDEYLDTSEMRDDWRLGEDKKEEEPAFIGHKFIFKMSTRTTRCLGACSPQYKDALVLGFPTGCVPSIQLDGIDATIASHRSLRSPRNMRYKCQESSPSIHTYFRYLGCTRACELQHVGCKEEPVYWFSSPQHEVYQQTQEVGHNSYVTPKSR
jgi:hypothetical protein